MHLLNIFANNILPILLISGAGFAIGKIFHLDPRPLGKIIFYIFSPLLVFNILTTTPLPFNRIAIMMGFTAVSTIIIAGIAFLAGKAFRLDRGALIIVVLTSMCTNTGNYGLPLVSFAFGQEALAYASIYFATSTLLFYTLGVIIASLGHLSLKKALLGVLKVPTVYSIILALVFAKAGWTLPEAIQRTVSLAADGAIPAMLVLLGLELTHVEWSRSWGTMSIPVIIRLVIGPLLGFGTGSFFGLHGAALQAGVTEIGTPTAVMTTILAAEYNLDTSLVTAIVFVGTLVSPITLTPLLYFLGR